MLRALLAALLVSLVALPHGICFCELLQCAHASKAFLSDDDSTPDDHEKDCPCKLRQAMFVVQAENSSVTGSILLDCPANTPGLTSIYSAIVQTNSVGDDKSINETIQLILCALRI